MLLAPTDSTRTVAKPEPAARTQRIDALLKGRSAIVIPPGTGGIRDTENDTAQTVRQSLAAGIFDVDGVLLASPHERAWREALAGFAPPECFTTALDQARVAGRPRLDGARAALEALGVADADGRAGVYADRKQTRLEALIAAGCVTAYPDALRFLHAVQALGWPVAAASSSKNANPMMRLIHYGAHRMLLDAFDANVCGRDLARGKPAPDIFLLAGAELGKPPGACFVVEDAPAGIQAARAAGMVAIGVARHNDAAGLWAAGADLVVGSLDELGAAQLAQGLLCQR